MSNSRSPLISVIIPAYNCERFIEKAVNSVRKQNYPDIEIITINDFSFDGTKDILLKLQKEDDRIKVIDLEENAGSAAARNMGLEKAKGEYIAFLDGDDIWLDNKLSRQINQLQKTGCDISYVSYGFIDENDNRIKNDFIVPKTCTFKSMLSRSVISMSTAVCRAESIKDLRFDENVYHEDLLFWLTALKNGCSARGIADVLTFYRFREGTKSKNKLNSAKERYRIFKRLDIPFFRRIYFFTKYAFGGIKKYR